jgi:hypothetical protein
MGRVIKANHSRIAITKDYCVRILKSYLKVRTLNPATFLPTEENCKEVVDEMYSSRLDLMDTPALIQTSNSSLVEAALSRVDGKRPGLQSLLLTTSYRLKPYHKDGLPNKLNFEHWSRHHNMQREIR